MSTDVPPTETAAFERTCRELVDRILDGELDRENLESAKLTVCGEFGSPKVPTNGELLEHAPPERRSEAADVLRRKPVRTASGVTPVAIMTSPAMCPHGKCLYCPGGPASEFSSAQSYTGHEPAAARGVQTDYDPYAQVTLRLDQLRHIGHPLDKVELILMGGTMTARSHDYQTWFVKRALEAMNDYDPSRPPGEPADAADPDRDGRGDRRGGRTTPDGIGSADEASTTGSADVVGAYRYLEDVIADNETAAVRNVATTFETKPDWCGQEQIDRMLSLGGTKVEVGVQTTFDHVNRAMHRGHGTAASVEANRRLRDAGFKVGFHMMPGQPGMDAEMSLEDFERLFEDPQWRPDYLKIYPTLVVRGTRVYDMWRRGEYEPLTNEEAADLVASVKAMLPPYVRLQRVQRDIPADFIDAGVWKSNLRQLARERLEARGERCDCIRCREVGMNDAEPSTVTMLHRSYEAAGATEHFISFEDEAADLLVGFCRLRFPGNPERRELEGAAIVRELHVYGSEVTIGDGMAADDDGNGDGDGDDDGGDRWQHRGFGRRLLGEAERLAADEGYRKLSVISGIGAREYYRRKLGYYQDGPYVSTWLDE